MRHLEQSWQQRVEADDLLLLRKAEFQVLTTKTSYGSGKQAQGITEAIAAEDNSFLTNTAQVKTLLLHKY